LKKITVVITGCFGLLLAGRLLAAEKTGYVDMQKVFKNYNKAQESEKVFKKEVDGQQAKISKLQDEIKGMQAELEKKKDVLKEAEKKKKEDELKERMQEFSKLW
jgi:Skp family chaperone for outer membrane proteins